MAAAVGKRIQAVSRTQFAQTLEASRPRGQIGGWKGKEPAQGAHHVRLTARIAVKRHIPLVTIYIDHKSAYHNLIRSLAVGTDTNNQRENEIIRAELDKIGTKLIPDGHPAMKEGRLQSCGASLCHLNNAREMNQDCWTLAGGTLLRTRKGSRPVAYSGHFVHGGPWGDHKELEKAVAKYVEVQVGVNRLGFQTFPIVWADDIAVQIPMDSNEALLEVTPCMMQDIGDILTSRGFTVNYDRGKKERQR